MSRQSRKQPRKQPAGRSQGKQQRAGQGWPPWRNPKAYSLSVAGALLIVLGLTVIDKVAVVFVGFLLAVGGWLVSRRST